MSIIWIEKNPWSWFLTNILGINLKQHRLFIQNAVYRKLFWINDSKKMNFKVGKNISIFYCNRKCGYSGPSASKRQTLGFPGQGRTIRHCSVETCLHYEKTRWYGHHRPARESLLPTVSQMETRCDENILFHQRSRVIPK